MPSSRRMASSMRRMKSRSCRVPFPSCQVAWSSTRTFGSSRVIRHSAGSSFTEAAIGKGAAVTAPGMADLERRNILLCNALNDVVNRWVPATFSAVSLRMAPVSGISSYQNPLLEVTTSIAAKSISRFRSEQRMWCSSGISAEKPVLQRKRSMDSSDSRSW